MAISKLIYDWLMRIFSSPKESGKITYDEAMELLKPHCKNIYLSDTYFSLTSKEEIAKFLDIDRTDFKKWENEAHDCPIPHELAWAYGLFFTDGTCGIDKNGIAYWKITNTDREYLERAKKAYEGFWTDFKFEIKEYPSERKGLKTNLGIRRNGLLNLLVSPKKRKGNYGKRKEWIQIMRNTFYFEKYKKLPKAMFDNERTVKKSFLMGTLAGNGCKRDPRLTLNGKIGVAGVMDCMYDCGWRFTLQKDKRHNQVYDIRYKIIENPELMKLPPCCDNFSYQLMGYFSKWNYSFCFGIAWSDTHAFNMGIFTTNGKDRQIYVIEPQTDACYTLEQIKNNPMYYPMRLILI